MFYQLPGTKLGVKFLVQRAAFCTYSDLPQFQRSLTSKTLIQRTNTGNNNFKELSIEHQALYGS